MTTIFRRPHSPLHRTPHPASLPRPALSFGACMLAALLAGCAGAPRVATPQPPPAPQDFKESGPWRQADAASSTSTVPDTWWQLFNDPVLDQLQGQLVVGNQNLRAVLAQVAQARAALGGSQAARLPTLTAQASATRADTSSSDSDNNRGPRGTISVSGTAAWELDLWGRLSHAVEGADARYRASLLDLAATRLSAQATLAQTYFALRAAEAQQALIERSIAVYQRSLELTQARHQSGVAPQTDVLQAQTQ